MVAFKLSKSGQNKEGGTTIENGLLKDEAGSILLTSGSDPDYKIALFKDFEKDQDAQNPQAFNEHLFESLKLEDTIWECCTKGHNLTVFAFED